jgi:hypothetical protein
MGVKSRMKAIALKHASSTINLLIFNLSRSFYTTLFLSADSNMKNKKCQQHKSTPTDGHEIKNMKRLLIVVLT